jgi:hypothetical protein
MDCKKNCAKKKPNQNHLRNNNDAVCTAAALCISNILRHYYPRKYLMVLNPKSSMIGKHIGALYAF